MKDVFVLEPTTTVLADCSYLMSYPYLLKYFAGKNHFSAEDVICGAHMAYGWMPTILALDFNSPEIDAVSAARILTKAKNKGVLLDEELVRLASLINNSFVGASKLLHFVAPERFAIWDSKVYAYIHEEAPHNYRVNKVENYQKYLHLLNELKKDLRFNSFHDSVNIKVKYDVSAFRALELVMYLNAPVIG